MKHIIVSLFALPFIALCFCMILHAQSPENDLDQVELVKQLTGTWITDAGDDSTIVFECVPVGKGYKLNNNLQASGETYISIKGLMGFQENYQHVVMYNMWPNGGIMRDLGKFISDTKAKFDRFSVNNPNKVSMKYEINFITQDEFKQISTWRGNKDSWDDAEVTEWIWTRVKE